MRLYTIGHSTRTLDELVEALRGFGVQTLVDVRTVPRSRHVPQFNRETLSRTLPRRGIRYRHAPALGGLRRPRADSINTAWRNTSFRGFADYMGTPEFEEAVRALRRLAREEGPVALMCAEAVPWRCHRSLIADALAARRDGVMHIMTPGSARPHALTPWAVVDGTTVTYPGPPPERSAGPRTPQRRVRGRGAATRAAQEPLL
ncbi:MAG TPA: DUF488 domain-containing protein [bacterium]|nr:DUF488 domain-containing protein [bacterium]